MTERVPLLQPRDNKTFGLIGIENFIADVHHAKPKMGIIEQLDFNIKLIIE